MSEFDYLQICNLLQKIYDNNSCDDIEYDFDDEYHSHSQLIHMHQYVKKTANFLIFIINVINIGMIFYQNFYNNK